MSDPLDRLQEYVLVAEDAAHPVVGWLWVSWMFFLGAAVAWGKVSAPWAALLFPLVTLFIAILGARVSRRWVLEIAKAERVARSRASARSSGSTWGDQGVSRN